MWQQLPPLGNLGKISSRAPHPPWPRSGGKPRRSRGPGDGARKGQKKADTVPVSSESSRSCRASGLMGAGRASWLRQEPRERACTVVYETRKWQKSLFQRGLHLLVSTKPSQPTLPPGAGWDTAPHLTAPPRCAVFQEPLYLPTSVFVRSTCSLKPNENSLPDQFVSEVSWFPAPLWVISFCLRVRTIRLATA